MTRRFITFGLGALVGLGLASSRATAQVTGPGIGTPLVPGADATNSRVSTRGANFLEIGLGARAMGMAGAYAALAEGFSALYWNLAGTAEVQNVAGGLHYAQLYGKDGLDFLWGGALLPVAGGVAGIQIGQMSSGDIVRTSYEFPDGGDPFAGETFDFTATVAEISYGRRLTDRLNVGLGIKYATEGISNAKATYFGLDVGVKFRTGLYGTTLGASLSNVGSSGQYRGSLIEANTFNTFAPGIVRVNYRTDQFEMPTIFRFSLMTDLVGGAEALLSQRTDLGTLRAVGEFSNAIDTDLQGALGLEFGWRELVYVRTGKRWMNESMNGVNDQDQSAHFGFGRGLAFGGGIRLPLGGRHVGFDYAWNGAGELPNTNHFTFEFGF
jgi:hypothetical protein